LPAPRGVPPIFWRFWPVFGSLCVPLMQRRGAPRVCPSPLGVTDVSERLSILEVKRALKAGPYAWPGGYPLYFVTCDGAALSFAAMRERFREEAGAVAAVQVNWEDLDLTCDHTGARIESAYAEDAA
jgi:hypothetical protein